MRSQIAFFVLNVIMIVSLAACHSITKNTAIGVQEAVNMHSTYDDSSLNSKAMPIMLPYNRLIDPAGKVISFGDPRTENHSLDVKLIRNSTVLAVEDRFGITLIDTTTDKVTARWTYSDDGKYAGLMSTYSGLKIRNSGPETQIFWSAADGGSRSYVMQAKWDGQKDRHSKRFYF